MPSQGPVPERRSRLWRDGVEAGAGAMSRGTGVAAVELGTKHLKRGLRIPLRLEMSGVWVSKLRWRFGFDCGVLPPLLRYSAPGCKVLACASRIPSPCSWRGLWVSGSAL